MRRLLLPLCVFALLVGVGWFPYAAFRQVSSRAASLASCEDNGLGAWRLILDREKGKDGSLPDPKRRATLAARYAAQSTHFQLICNMGAPYEWDEGVRRVTTAEAAVPLAWCGRPHGFTKRWRNVLFSDLSVRKAPEPSEHVQRSKG